MKKGWEVKTIGDVCEFQRGLTYAKGDEVDVSDNVVLRATNIDLTRNLLIFDDLKCISDKVAVAESKKVKKGSLLICMASGSKSHLGKVAFIDDDYGYAFGGFMGMLTPLNGLLPKYLFHLMTSETYKDFIGSLSDGANINNLTFDKLRSFPIPVPPLPEQQRIVGLLDEAFEGLATAKANAEKNLQNARALFESHLQSVFSQRGEGWVETTVRQVAAPTNGSIRTGPFGSQLLHSEFVDQGIAVLGIDNAVANEFRWGRRRFITPEKYRQLERYTVRPGDVLITIMGTCGRCAIVPEDIQAAINTKHICCITLDKTQCLPSYLHIYFLHAPQSQEFLVKHAKGAIMAGLNMGLIQELPVMLPPIKVQADIIEAADALRSETQRLAAIYSRKLAALEGLKKALLHQAFSGGL